MAIVTQTDATPDGRRRYQLHSPADGSAIGTLECDTDAEVAAAIDRARSAQPAWAGLDPSVRAGFLRSAADILIDRIDDIVETITRESGKPATEALMIDVFAAADALTHYAKHGPSYVAPETVKPHGVLRLTKKVRLHHQPLGVVGVISPWNGPLILTLNPAIQALIAGNTVVMKPSEVTPWSGALAGEILNAAGLPDGVAQVVMGDGQTGAALVEGGVDKIHFTGSVATGRKIAEACGRQLIGCTLELGGKDAMIVCADADLDAAAGGAVAGSMFNTGQYCCGTERVYVHESVAEAFTTKVVERVDALRQGPAGADVGPMCWDRQLDKVIEQVDRAVAGGAEVLAGGRRNPDLPDGLFFEPTVLTGVSHDMAVMTDETFGPVLPIVTFSTVEEAIELANDSIYGLSGSVYTSDVEQGERIATRLKTGSVSVNDMAVTYGIPEAPFGGRGDSGVGQANGLAGVRSFCHTQPVVIDRQGGKQTAQQYPYSPKGEKALKAIIRMAFGRGRKKLIR